MEDGTAIARVRSREWTTAYRRRQPEADRWAVGYGVIDHSPHTQARVFALAERLRVEGVEGDGVPLFEVLAAADRLTSAAMWLVVHETYARDVFLDGRDLRPASFRRHPEGHTGGALNMVPAYAGYMAANAISGLTRGWIMGQGHTVAAIDSVNLLLRNTTPAHAARYSLSDEGLTRYVRDVYSYELSRDGRQASCLGSHVNPHTAGALAEGGYLGFTELQYVHMPLPGERMVAFLSDGAFEEQRGSDWAPRWWRAEDSGLVVPLMIQNGRRIDQRTTMSQQGGAPWLMEHQRLNGFDPFILDGRDPAAFAWAILEGEARLQAASEALRAGDLSYPAPLPYGIALAPKGAGFPGEGTNLAHNLPLGDNPRTDPAAAELFNEGARRLWVPPRELIEALGKLQRHELSGRPRERDHALACRDVRLREEPEALVRPVPERRADPAGWTRASPMDAVDVTFLATVDANPHLRPRVGNPDEMRSNRMTRTLERLKFRVTAPEQGVPEALLGAVITALNEEAVAAAALANKGGINIVVSYEAFAAKMHGEVRQEIVWAEQCREAGRLARWLSVPLVLTSHTWENAKNQHSHQDPAMAEAMLGEPSNVSRVLFPPDFNTAAACLRGTYRTQGQVWTLVVPKREAIPDLFSAAEAERLLAEGALRLTWAGHEVERQRVILTAIGAYQLEEVLRASRRLAERDVPHSVVCMLEPGRFRLPRGPAEHAHLASPEARAHLYPDAVTGRVFVTHTRPEIMLGTLGELATGPGRTHVLGYLNRGGTLDVPGMLWANRSTWVHVVAHVARTLGVGVGTLLVHDELTPPGVEPPHPERPLQAISVRA